jgi:hypothetical protein
MACSQRRRFGQRVPSQHRVQRHSRAMDQVSRQVSLHSLPLRRQKVLLWLHRAIRNLLEHHVVAPLLRPPKPPATIESQQEVHRPKPVPLRGAARGQPPERLPQKLVSLPSPRLRRRVKAQPPPNVSKTVRQSAMTPTKMASPPPNASKTVR